MENLEKLKKPISPEENLEEELKMDEEDKEEKKEKDIVDESKDGKSIFSKVKKFIGDSIPAVLEAGSRIKTLVEGTIDFTGDALNKIIKPTSKLLTGFIPQGHIAMIVDKLVVKSSEISIAVAKSLAKASFNIFTMGSFAWLDAFRQHMAVNSATHEINSAKNKDEVIALSYIDHLKDGQVKKALNEYYSLRKKLSAWREDPEKNKEKISEAAKKIAQFEIVYQDCVDFSNLKSIFEKGDSFSRENEVLVDRLAEDTADKMITDIENYYKTKIGKIAGKVKGEWVGTAKEKEGRQKLKEKIAQRLMAVMKGEMSQKDIAREIKKINGSLKKSFAVNKRYLKSAIYTVMGLAMHNIDLFDFGSKMEVEAPDLSMTEKVADASVNNTLDNIAAAGKIHGEITDYPFGDYVINDDLTITNIDNGPSFDPAEYGLDLSNMEDESVLVDSGVLGNELDKVADKAGELIYDNSVSKDIRKVKRIYDMTKFGLGSNPVFLGPKLGYKLLKFLL